MKLIKKNTKILKRTLLNISVIKTEDEQAKRRKQQIITAQKSEDVYCPHAYLILSYQETLNDGEKIEFRKHYLRKVMPSEADVIILQDIKDLVLFLLVTPVSPQFINFLHLSIVDRFLRTLIVYFQRYLEIWENLMQERAATMKKAANPLARGHRTRYAEEMRVLRCVLGREYLDIIMGCQDGSQYHHMMRTDNHGSSVTMQSQGEKDLRIFEALISVAHRVVWIALRRKHYTLIEIELHRLLRTEVYNMAYRQNSDQVIRDMLEDDIRILQGPKMTQKRRLLRNSPLSGELIYKDCDYHLLSLGVLCICNWLVFTEVTDVIVQDPKIIYLRSALFVEEEMLLQLGIKVGILGHNRSDYDITLMPLEEQQVIDSTEIRLLNEKVQKTDENLEGTRKSELTEEFLMKEPETPNGRYDRIRRQARRKWIMREMERRSRILVNAFSLTMTAD